MNNNKYKHDVESIENVNMNNIKVRDHDELDDSSGSEIGGDRDDYDDKVQA
jgi:hypothetical protein